MTEKKVWTWFTTCKCATSIKDKVTVTTTIENPTRQQRKDMFWKAHKYEIHPSRCPKCQGK